MLRYVHVGGEWWVWGVVGVGSDVYAIQMYEGEQDVCTLQVHAH